MKLLNAIKQSDDYNEYGHLFMEAARQMIEDGRAVVEDFERNGGWIRSTKNPGVYFMLVGLAINVKDRWYFNTQTGDIFQ